MEEKSPMTSHQRRAAGRRRAWGRGPIILRFESLEGRQLMATTAAPEPLPDLVGADFATAHNLDWGDSFHAVGTILNQGKAAATSDFNVQVYVSSSATLSANAVPLGGVTIPAGLAPGKTAKFDQVFSLPPTAVPDYNAGDPVYIMFVVDPQKKVKESNDRNNQGVGQGYDESPVAITPHQPSLLTGSALGVSTTQATWGQPITITAQVRNNAQGDAPATRARLVLTPAGLNPGSAYDYTIGYLDVPAVAAWQTVNLTRQITLPATPPSTLNGGTQFTLSMNQDSGFVTDPIYPHLANQGAGLDTTSITITPDPNAPADAADPNAPKPDLAPSDVTTTPKNVLWGYDFQVSTTLENLGLADSGPVRVEFLLTGTDGQIANSIYLGETTLPGLAQGTSQDITQTLHLPNKLPSGVTLPSSVLGRVAVLVDPDRTLDQTLRSNDLAESAPFTLRVLGTDGSSTVPNSPPVGTTLGKPRPAGTLVPDTTAAPATNTVKARRQHTTKLHRQAVAKKQSLTDKIEHELKVFPDHVKSFVNDLLGKNDNQPKARKKAAKKST
jgi:hypothetical protein